MHKFIQIIFISIAFFGFNVSVNAHSQLETSQPKKGASISEVPNTIELNFTSKIRLTQVLLTVDSENDANKADTAVMPTKLDLSKHKSFSKTSSLINPLKSKGAYRVQWRGIGLDGHVLKGEFSFLVN